MDAVTAHGVEFPVSVWMKRVIGSSSMTPPPGGVSHNQQRVIVVIEPVERSSAFFTMDQDGKIVLCDPWFAVLFGFNESQEVVGRSILNFIPSLKLPSTSELTEKVSICCFQSQIRTIPNIACQSLLFPLKSISSGQVYSQTTWTNRCN